MILVARCVKAQFGIFQPMLFCVFQAMLLDKSVLPPIAEGCTQGMGEVLEGMAMPMARAAAPLSGQGSGARG